VLRGITTADGRTGGIADSSLPCWSRIVSLVLTEPETKVFKCSIWAGERSTLVLITERSYLINLSYLHHKKVNFMILRINISG
jgi:hypothetical protein